ncbi:phenylacetate-CoA oxygenase/reductase subunit PaaK [Nocardia panacis]|uniref:Phenylacetate-CoA oxygenase/reductase subunit PaaK n=1 Tax=Nocardia panacis TaxID=2340916 RepID=A0A3A4KDJ5_9NOCA|nr:1,2-phenylacetyl-CoA epoxidase subunit PaaE [Nocardia panacis]RJO73555.1 phenylacetate-CoA oxygenase/reductase subunit PaaK [Nocardia panacis]
MSTAETRVRAFHPLQVAAVRHLCEDAVAVTFAVPDHLTDEFRFRPGQFLTLRRTVDGVEERRSYSICAPQGDAPGVGVREVTEGLFSRWLVHELAPGDTVQVQAPSGGFTADPALGGDHLLIGAGSGITPLLSIAASLLANPASSVTLLYGNRRSGTVMFADELADLKDQYGARFSLIHVLSREPRDVELFSGRLDAERIGAIIGALIALDTVDHAWLCGPLGMVQDATTVLSAHGMPTDRIHRELFFVGDTPPPPELHREPGVTGPSSKVTITLDGRSSTADLPCDRTILDAAERVRSDLPFACKGGVCGTCRAKITDGTAEMRRNYALEDAEVAAGFVLTCQTYPTSETLVVDFDA